jgi:hypothetical protein
LFRNRTLAAVLTSPVTLKCLGKIPSIVVGSLVLVMNVPAREQDSSYQSIASRNAFALKSPEPEKKQDETPNVILSGITTILGEKLALLTVVPRGPGTPLEYLRLTVGKTHGLIHVLTINEDQGTVEIELRGIPQTLKLSQ